VAEGGGLLIQHALFVHSDFHNATAMFPSIVLLVSSRPLLVTNALGKTPHVEIPEALGGGKPRPAELILKKETFETWRQTGSLLPTAADSTSSGRVLIL
jgi:hypothetical protein